MFPKNVSKRALPLRAAAALVLILSTSCARTTLSPEPLPVEVTRLSAAAPQALVLDVRAPAKNYTAGYQYLLVLFPFGRVVVDDPALFVKRRAEIELALLGYRTVPPESPALRDRYRLLLTLQHASAQAFDLLALRRIVCRVRIKGELLDADNRMLALVYAEGRGVSWKRFAFAPQLNYVFNQAVAKAVGDAAGTLLRRPGERA